nr:hypothetical protein [Anaerolineaceae bacterium]
ISPSLEIFGRRLVINDSDRLLIMFIYGVCTYWFLGAGVAGVRDSFPGLALMVVAILVSALTVEPFLYAALLIEIAVLVSIPLLIPQGSNIQSGGLRYLTFQSLAVPVVLLAGWASIGVEANPDNQAQLNQTIILLAIGFNIWLAAFPFQSWVPMLISEIEPLIGGFLLTIIPSIILIILLNFLNAFSWIRNFEYLSVGLQLMGGVLVAIAGIMTGFQKNLSKIFGYAILFEIGFAVLSISITNQIGLEILFASFLPRIFGLSLMALSLSVIKKEKGLDFQDVKGLMKDYPFACGALVLSGFSIAGLPLLAGFSTRIVLLQQTAESSNTIFIAVIIGTFGFLFGVFRILHIISAYQEKPWKLSENIWQSLLLGGGILVIFIMGIFPNQVLSPIMELIHAFGNILN